jgi:thymidylate synthase
MLISTSPSSAYLEILKILLSSVSSEFICSPRNSPCYELMNYLFTVKQPTAGPIITKSITRNQKLASYLDAENYLYLTGEMKASVWEEKASKFWGKLANPDGTINSNYGWLTMFNRSLPNGLTPWEWAKNSLLLDHDSRQAYVRVALPEHQWQGNKDQVCTMHVMFMLRKNYLHETVVMRSNDVVRGLAYDMPWWCLCLDKMVSDLNENGLSCQKGTYSHFAHSLHLYERDIPLVQEMLGEL